MTTKVKQNSESTNPELAVCINNFNQSLCRDKNNYVKPKNSLWKFILSFFIALFVSVSVNAQSFERDDLANIEAGALVHSATYFGVSALDWEDKWKYILPAITVNTAGVIKEISDSQRPNSRFDGKDLLLNNVGMLISLGLIEGLKAVGVPENIAISSVFTASALSLGLTVKF